MEIFYNASNELITNVQREIKRYMINHGMDLKKVDFTSQDKLEIRLSYGPKNTKPSEESLGKGLVAINKYITRGVEDEKTAMYCLTMDDLRKSEFIAYVSSVSVKSPKNAAYGTIQLKTWSSELAAISFAHRCDFSKKDIDDKYVTHFPLVVDIARFEQEELAKLGENHKDFEEYIKRQLPQCPQIVLKV